MKIAIGAGYSGFNLPKWLMEKCNDENPIKMRFNVAKYLEENCDYEIDEQKINKPIKEFVDKYKILKIKGKFYNIYCTKDEENLTVMDYCTYCIVDVDITRPWRIDEYDGSEGIQYLDYDVIDKEFNYCRLKD